VYKLSRFYLLLPHNLSTFFLVEGMYYTHYLSFSEWDDFYARDTARKLSFKNKILPSFSTWRIFSIQVFVRKKLMKALATFLDPLIFSQLISRECACSVECTLPVSLVITFHVVFTLLFDSAVSLPAMLPLHFLYNFFVCCCIYIINCVKLSIMIWYAIY
jgi:hypothetical protein